MRKVPNITCIMYACMCVRACVCGEGECDIGITHEQKRPTSISRLVRFAWSHATNLKGELLNCRTPMNQSKKLLAVQQISLRHYSYFSRHR